MADKTKKCEFCNKVFEYTRANQKYCSEDCYKAVKTVKRREYYKNGKSKTKKCKLCNKVFEYTHANQKYCSKECYEIVKKGYCKKTEPDKLLEISKEREDLRKIKPKDKDYKLKRFIVKAGLNEKSTWTIERDYYFFKPCKFDKNNENLYYIHDFNDNQDYSGSLIKLTDTGLSEVAFEYYKNKGNLVFYERLHSESNK